MQEQAAWYAKKPDIQQRTVPRLEKYLADYCDLPAMSREEPQLYLLIVHSKDNQYAAFQLLTYSSFLYKPVTELCCLKGEKASTFIKTCIRHMDFFIDIFLHIDQHLITLVQEYHEWTYALLFLIIFCETGLVVTPFLPGDSLLFVSGAVASLPGMPLEISLLMMVIFIAAVLGDSCNYLIGHYFGKNCSPNQTQRSSSKVIWRKPIISSRNMAEKP